MRYYFLLIVAILFSSGLSFSAMADPAQTRALLDQMSHGFRELNYRGTFSYQQGDTIQSLRITHAVINGEEYERLEYMDGKRREIVRRGHNLTCIHPGHQLVRLYQQHQSLKQNTQDNPLDLNDYYELSIVGKGRIADHNVVELLVRPKDTHRYVHRLSLDVETGLLLRSIVEGGAGTVLERFQFADIQIGEQIPIEYFQIKSHSYQAKHLEPSINAAPNRIISRSVGKKQWLVNWLPGGFTTVFANQQFASDDMVTFTDGLSVFSVFLEKIKVDNRKNPVVDNTGDGNARRGATVAYTRSLMLDSMPYRVTVIGEIPKQTARQVAQSVKLLQP